MTGVLAQYEALVATGELKPDAEQEGAAVMLNRLQAALEAGQPRGLFLSRLIGQKAESLRGVYLWGHVGRGKSMLMDMFHSCLAIQKKRRVHFHEFMIEVHARLRIERQKEQGDPILPVVEAIAAETLCLCFDEMVVNNSADAMIMSRLFTGLIDAGVTLVTTSNRAPSALYKDGLNREHFLPFIALIENRLDVVALSGPTDYRMERLAGVKTWHSPLGNTATEACRDAFFRLTDFSPDDAEHVPSEDIDLGGGRMLHVPKSLKGVAVFSFKRLCAEARGASDYLAIARRYHSVVIVGIPQMSRDSRNEAARFVTLIDALYEHKVKLIAAAAAAPAELYPEGVGRFEFERTTSRLIEMQSTAYLALGHGED
jgi:cell division protein ZapE